MSGHSGFAILGCAVSARVVVQALGFRIAVRPLVSGFGIRDGGRKGSACKPNQDCKS